MKTRNLSIAVFATFIATASFAQNNKNEHPNYPNDEIPSYIKDGITYGVKSNTPLVFVGIRDKVIGANPEEMALNWAINHKSDLKLENASQLVPYFKHSGHSGHTVRLRQLHNGIPVFLSEVAVHISPSEEVTYVTNSFDPTIQAINTNPSITETKALKLAKDHLKVDGRINYEVSELHVYNRMETTKLIYKVVIEAEYPLGSWEVLVDANSGEIYRAADKACNHANHSNAFLPAPPPANGVGNVFLPDPLSFAQVSYGGQYVDGSDATNASLNAATSSVTLLDINFTGSMYELKGPYAEIKDFESPYNGLFSQATSVFNYNRFDNAFEAVNCYYHIDGSMRYINDTLNIPLMPFQYATGVRFDPSGLSGADNSHYLGGTGTISFGEGGVDDAEDADVILHELGHGIHDWLTGGNLSQVNGLSEGSGDYWASSYSRMLNQWTTADAQYYWMFSWDGHNPFWSGRVTNYAALYPGGLVGQIHTDGQIWATALLRIWEGIGREKVDKAFLEGLAMTGSSTNQQNAAIAVRQAAIDMNYSCADIDVFTQEFTATGYVLPALPQPTGVENSTICAGESIIVNGNVYDANNPTGTEVIPGATAACDSTVTINLTVLTPISSNLNTQICSGQSITVNGTVYDENNTTGTEVILNGSANGCDSTVYVNLTVVAQLTSSINTAICPGESITVNGTIYDENNLTGTEVFPNVGPNGCDSVVTINLTALAPATGSETSTICYTESIVVNGTTYNAANPSGTEVFLGGAVNGCDSTVTVNLTVEPQIDLTVNVNEPTMSAVQVGATYQWIDCSNGNTPIAGATQQTYTATANGNYAVQVTIGGCTETSPCVTISKIGIEELEELGVKIYPNPSGGVFTIENENSDELYYSITNAEGRLVVDAKLISANKSTIDFSKEGAGVYFLHLNSQQLESVIKIIIE